MPFVHSDGLHALTRAICIAADSEAREADLVADHLVAANLAGHDSHGVGMLPAYVEGIRAGHLMPNQHAIKVREQGAVLAVEGGRGYGQVIGYEAMDLGIGHARHHHVALVAIRNSYHLGRIGHWAEQCAAAGFASIHFVNGIDHEPLQAPFGGADARMVTNPFCVALPGANGPPVLLDMATSTIAMGKVRVARNQGVPVPEGCLLDGEGRPTVDPNVMYAEPQGALIAMGLHKGSGLAIACELLAGALTGGWTMQPEHPRAGGIVNNMLSVIVDPEALGERSALEHEVDALVRWVKASPPRTGFEEVLVPGEPERRRRAERLARGVEIDAQSWREIREAALAVGVSDQDFDELAG